MTRRLTATLATGDALLSITVPVREETGSHLPNGRAWFAVGEPTYCVEGDRVAECELLRTFGQPVLDALTDRLWAYGTLTEEWDGLND